MPKLAAAIMTGTMARPSRPSVRFTAFPAPTIMKTAKKTKNQPRLTINSLKNGNTSERRERHMPELDQRNASEPRNDGFDAHPRAAGKSIMRLFRDLQIIVIEADHAEAERDPKHHPDIGIGRVCPQKRRDQHAGQDHQPAHRRRAGLGDNVRFRTVGADRLTLALQEPQMIDDVLTEQKDEKQRGDDRAAGAERDVAEHVEDGKLFRQIDQPIEHRISLARTRLRVCGLRLYLGAGTPVAAP